MIQNWLEFVCVASFPESLYQAPLHNMANNSTSNGFYESEECPYLEEVAWRDEFLLTEGIYNHLVAIVSINSISVLPTVLLNALVIFAVATRGQLRNKATILLACLAGADLLTGLLGQPIRIAVEVQRLRKIGIFCGALERVNMLSLGWHIFATLSHLLLITVDRYIAIKKPLRYREIVTTRRVTVAVLLAWASTIFVAIQDSILAAINSDTNIYSVYWNLTVVTLNILGLISIIVIVAIYSYIFLEVRRQQRAQTEHLSVEEIATIRRNNRGAKTLGIILITLIVTYLPMIVSSIMYYSVNLGRPVLNCLASWVATFIMLSSLCNPVIYCWRMKKFRQAFLEILHLRNRENNQPQEAIEMQIIQPAH